MRLGLTNSVLLLIVITVALSVRLPAQTTLEHPGEGSWATNAINRRTTPGRNFAPAWAQNGLIRFARWDGGRIETAKALLSGWPNFWPPDPNYLYTTDHWYDLGTIRLLLQAGINMIWVTFSNGFSNQTEKLHQAEVARYISECHHLGIHVMAYESIANMFWQDMFNNVQSSRQWVLMDKNGQPTPYGAAAYKKVGYVSRYVADPGNSEWQAYLRGRIKLAVEAGADGVMYDNNVDDNVPLLAHLYESLYHYGSTLKKDFLLMGNFHDTTYVLNRMTNCMTTEDGVEPGVYDAQHARNSGDPGNMLSAGQGYLVDNIGLFRLLAALSQGWKLNLVENGTQEFGGREALPMSPQRRQLAMAEAMSFGAADELFVEDVLANGLWNSDPLAEAVWRAIAQYNRFFAENEEYYRGVRSAARLAVVLDDSSSGVDLLNNLAAHNILFDVVYARDLNNSGLSRYDAVAVLTAEKVSDKSLNVLENYVRDGGNLFVAGTSTSRDEEGHERPRPRFFGHTVGKGRCIYVDRIPPIGELAQLLKRKGNACLPEVQAPAGVIYNIVEQPGSHHLIVHLLNYTASPVDNVFVKLGGKYRSAMLFSPDDGAGSHAAFRQLPAPNGRVTVPRLKIYSLLVLNR